MPAYEYACKDCGMIAGGFYLKSAPKLSNQWGPSLFTSASKSAD